MNPEDNRKFIQTKKTTLLIVVLILVAGILGWWIGRSDGSDKSGNTAVTEPNSTVTTISSNTAGPDVKSLVTYKLPDGWKEASCPNAAGSVFVIPAGADEVDCSTNPSAPVKISVDPSNNDDCNDLQNVQNVSKHICISLFINDSKSLKAETRYNQESSYKRDTTIHAYYINTGKGIIKAEYIYNNSNDYQTGFDDLANSIAVKN